MPGEVARITAEVRQADEMRRRHPHPQRLRASASPTRWRPSRPARCRSREPSTATASATGNCNLTTVMPCLVLKMGYECIPKDNIRQSARSVDIRRRSGQRAPRHPPAVRRRDRVRAQGRHPRQRHREGRAQLRAHRTGNGRQSSPRAGQRAERPQQHPHEGARTRHGPAARTRPRCATFCSSSSNSNTPATNTRPPTPASTSSCRSCSSGTSRFSSCSTLPRHLDTSTAKQASRRVEASVKLEVDGKTIHTVAEGDGPINALDKALR